MFQALNAFLQSHHAACNDILRKLKLTATSKITDVAVTSQSIENCEDDEMQIHNGDANFETMKNNQQLNGHAPEMLS